MRLTRRGFLIGAGSVLAGVAGLAGYAYAIEPMLIRLEQLSLRVPDLPPHLDGFRIGVLADLHVGTMVPVGRGVEASSRLAAEKPDIVLVAGDMTGYVASHAEEQRLIETALAPVRGAYGVLGNWDYFGHKLPPGVRRQTAVRILVNEGLLIAPGLWLGGLDDGLHGHPDVDRALTGCPEGAVRLLLAHEPDLADLVRPEHRVSLQISGHTHGGQVRLPLIGPLLKPPLGRKYFAGLNRAPACAVYTSRGVGVTGIPVRFMVPPEVAIITLKRSV